MLKPSGSATEPLRVGLALRRDAGAPASVAEPVGALAAIVRAVLGGQVAPEPAVTLPETQNVAALPEEQVLPMRTEESARAPMAVYELARPAHGPDAFARSACLERARRVRPSARITVLEDASGVSLEFAEFRKPMDVLRAASWKLLEEQLRPRRAPGFMAGA